MTLMRRMRVARKGKQQQVHAEKHEKGRKESWRLQEEQERA